MSETLTDKLEALDASADFSDPQTYSKLLGYDGEAPAAEQPAAEVKGEIPAAPVAAAVPAAAAPAQDSSATPAAAETVDPVPAGIATKDGKHVIPMAVLTDTRQALQRANERARELAEANERLKQELEARAAGTKPEDKGAQAPEDAIGIPAEELAELEEDFPAVGAVVAKLAKANEALQAQLREVASRQPTAATAAPATQEVDVQALIDQRPLLSQWQAKGGLAWKAAVEADQALMADPAWSTKPYAERFAEVERRIAEDFGIPIATPAAPTAAKPGPAAPPAAPVPMIVLPTLTDFNGSPATVGDPMAGMAVGKMVDTAMSMDMEALRRLAGLSY